MRRAFTLVELLIVMLIIGIVISIVIPALGGARHAARRASTQQVLTSFVQAASQFRNDNSDKQPGFFSPKEMGLDSNLDYGLSAMENAMLDLMGGLVDGPGDPSEVLELDLGVDNVAYVNPGLVGKGAYFQPDSSYYKPMVQGQQVGQGDHIGDTEGDLQLFDVVDAWGNPLLLWAEDFYGPTDIKEVEDFARISAGAGEAASRARFYWASNACFLTSETLGKGGKSQIDDYNGSLIGAQMNGDPPINVSENLMALAGNPSFPDDRSQNANQILATTPRGAFIIHSAGNDGVFLGKRDRGTAKFALRKGGGNMFDPLLYGFNFKSGAQDHTEDGQIVTEDVLGSYDDMIQSGGN
jgi:prepilin-type N-terminal cleavage/methylation domain-containing protein